METGTASHILLNFVLTAPSDTSFTFSSHLANEAPPPFTDDDHHQSSFRESNPVKASPILPQRKGKSKGGSQEARTAKNLLTTMEQWLYPSYVSWILDYNKDVRRSRSSKTQGLAIDVAEFFEDHLYRTDGHDDDIRELEAADKKVQEELYLILGRSFAAKEPELVTAADKKRQFRQTTSGRSTTTTKTTSNTLTPQSMIKGESNGCWPGA